MDRSTFTERRRERTNFIKSSSMARRLFGDTVRSGYEINIEVQRAEFHRVILELLSTTHLPNHPPPKTKKKKKKKRTWAKYFHNTKKNALGHYFMIYFIISWPFALKGISLRPWIKQREMPDANGWFIGTKSKRALMINTAFAKKAP